MVVEAATSPGAKTPGVVFVHVAMMLANQTDSAACYGVANSSNKHGVRSTLFKQLRSASNRAELRCTSAPKRLEDILQTTLGTTLVATRTCSNEQ